MTVNGTSVVADLATLYLIDVGRADVGHSVYVTAETAFYQAAHEGRGAGVWNIDSESGEAALDTRVTALEALGIKAYSRVFDHADTDMAVAAATAAIDLGSALPAKAVVLGVVADVTESFTNAVDAFEADVGISGGDADAYTASILDVDGGIALLQQWASVFAGAVTLAVTFTSDGGDLDTLTAGTVEITVYYLAPDDTAVAAP